MAAVGSKGQEEASVGSEGLERRRQWGEKAWRKGGNGEKVVQELTSPMADPQVVTCGG